jgi:hypothetical protein
MKKIGLLLGLIIVIGFLLSCNKKDKISSPAVDGEVNFLLTQPSVATATFIAKCTNYDIILDTAFFLDPNNRIYVQAFQAGFFSKNEEFMLGGYESMDGIWTIQLRGSVQGTDQTYDVSIPYDMNIENDDEE